jgi:hypothetical protein
MLFHPISSLVLHNQFVIDLGNLVTVLGMSHYLNSKSIQQLNNSVEYHNLNINMLKTLKRAFGFKPIIKWKPTKEALL